jgi:hypothetical protein
VLVLTLSLTDVTALRELFDGQLAHGRAFVPDAGDVPVLTPCELVLQVGDRTHRLDAEVVFVKAEEPGCGAGLQLAPMEEAAREALRAFVEFEDLSPSAQGLARNLQERIRVLTLVEQQRMAAGGTLSERVALERMYGPSVWETLLQNPRLTIPEVARIGRKGSLPRPLVEAIAANTSWLAAGEVQRALLSNPRSSSAVVDRVLGRMSRSDLQLVPQQTAYPGAVRQAAKKLLGR